MFRFGLEEYRNAGFLARLSCWFLANVPKINGVDMRTWCAAHQPAGAKIARPRKLALGKEKKLSEEKKSSNDDAETAEEAKTKVENDR